MHERWIIWIYDVNDRDVNVTKSSNKGDVSPVAI